MTVTRARPGVANSATFTPTNPGDEILDATFSKLTGASGNPFALPFTGGDITETIAGANQMTLNLVDPGLELLRAGTFNGVYEVNLDGVPFWVTQVSLVDTDTLSLLLEHRIIAKLRLHDSYLKVSRDSMTRAQFVFLMVNEIKDEEILYISPEIGVKQPITVAKTPKHAPVPGKAPGFTPGVKLKVKGVDATAAQLAQADALLAECVKLGTSSKVMQAIICAGIQESVLGADPSTFTPTTFDGAGTWGVLQVAAGSGSLPGSGIGAHDTTTMAHYFCIGGKGMEGGGAIAYSAAHPTSSPGDIARHVENPGSATAPYAQWEREAKAIVEAYTNSSIQYAGSPPGVAAATGEFYRGQPGQPEDSWTCALRLAAEVNWRAFVAGRHSLLLRAGQGPDDPAGPVPHRPAVDGGAEGDFRCRDGEASRQDPGRSRAEALSGGPDGQDRPVAGAPRDGGGARGLRARERPVACVRHPAPAVRRGGDGHFARAAGAARGACRVDDVGRIPGVVRERDARDGAVEVRRGAGQAVWDEVRGARAHICRLRPGCRLHRRGLRIRARGLAGDEGESYLRLAWGALPDGHADHQRLAGRALHVHRRGLRPLRDARADSYRRRDRAGYRKRPGTRHRMRVCPERVRRSIWHRPRREAWRT